jgi:tetratricopeptide (TPR) repeat protein
MTLSRKTLFLSACLVSIACGKGRVQTWERSVEGPSAAASPASVDVAAEGDAAWAMRSDRAKLEAAIAAWEKALQSKPGDPALLVKLARGVYFLADGYLRADPNARDLYLATFEKGTDYAERALVASSPEFKAKVEAGASVKEAVAVVGADGVPALYWYASNLGKWAKAKGFATTLGNKDTIRAVMDKCLALDPTYFFGGPDRYFGVFFAVAPSFAGGDLAKSEDHFKKSLSIAPDCLTTKVLMAENLATKKQDREMYKRLLEEVIAAPGDKIPELVPEMQVEKLKAADLLKAIDEKF